MQYKKYTADLICPIRTEPLQNSVLITRTDGTIEAIEPMANHDPAAVQQFKGLLVPGFVNTHCHLELSHMKGKVDTGTKLIPFITNVVTKRDAKQEEILDAIGKAEDEMYKTGVVAVGDISNTVNTFLTKAKGRLYYYTFVELFDFLQDSGAEKAFQDWKAVYDQLEPTEKSQKSMVPHAPYSVSKTLFEKINQLNKMEGITVSIHNQETVPENQLFTSKTGDFLDFYGKFGISLDDFTPIKKTSIYYALEHLNPHVRTLFVHNTLTNADEIMAATSWNKQTFWATCPNANLYIENRLPDYQAFMNTQANMTIGTDSLTSNWQLNILEELKTIEKYQSYVPLALLLKWATLNGAAALGLDHILGSFEPGKTPGIIHVGNMGSLEKLGNNAVAKRVG